MKEIERFSKYGFTGIISYYTGYDDTTPASQRYNLKIIKDDKIYIDSNRNTLSGAKTRFERWVEKNK